MPEAAAEAEMPEAAAEAEMPEAAAAAAKMPSHSAEMPSHSAEMPLNSAEMPAAAAADSILPGTATDAGVAAAVLSADSGSIDKSAAASIAPAAAVTPRAAAAAPALSGPRRSLPSQSRTAVADKDDAALQQKLAALHKWHARGTDEFHTVFCVLTYDPSSLLPAPLQPHGVCNLVIHYRRKALEFLFSLIDEKNRVRSRNVVLLMKQAGADAARPAAGEELGPTVQLDHDCDLALERTLKMVSKQHKQVRRSARL
jgi:hypothetical protein